MSFRLLFISVLFPLTLHASFIESTMGTAVVNDATATYHNPAALMLSKDTQWIALGSYAHFSSEFTGRSVSLFSGKTQSGYSKGHDDYYLPSLYVVTPIQDKIRVGFAVVSDILNSSNNETSILRYIKSNNQIENIDFIPGLGFQINPYLSIGAGFIYSHARFISNAMIELQHFNMPDSQRHNVTMDDSYGGSVGFVIKPAASTLIGFNYRSALSYQFHGKSYFNGTPSIVSSNYNFNFWTPPRSVLTMSHFVTPNTGFISTVQFVEWGIFKNVTAHGIATQMSQESMVLSQTVIPYHFHDSWILTLGGIQSITPTWVVRLAGTYNQSPSNGNYQITSGDGLIVGASMGYEFYKNMMIDASYAHTFIKNQKVTIDSRNSLTTGVNRGHGDAVSLKLTLNI